jgi:hypothetical protein
MKPKRPSANDEGIAIGVYEIQQRRNGDKYPFPICQLRLSLASNQWHAKELIAALPYSLQQSRLYSHCMLHPAYVSKRQHPRPVDEPPLAHRRYLIRYRLARPLTQRHHRLTTAPSLGGRRQYLRQV